MRASPFQSTTIVLIACFWVSISNAQILRPNLPSAQKLVVLINGEVIEGRVTQSAEQTVIETTQGSRLMLAADRVDFVCDSMQDAYWGKCARTKATDFAGQKALFYWCMKHKLHEQAQNQIGLLMESDKATAAEIEYLDRQLTIAISKKTKSNASSLAKSRPKNAKPNAIRPDISESAKASLSQAMDPKNETPNWTLRPLEIDDSIGTGELASQKIQLETFTPLPAWNPQKEQEVPVMLTPMDSQMANLPAMPESSVRQVGFEELVVETSKENEQPTTYKTISPDHRILSAELPVEPITVTKNVTNAELDQMTRSMPKGTLGPYRTKLERIMTNSCSAANCHDSKSEVMPLLSFGRTKPITRRMSQRNLFETLKFIDRSDPFASPLLDAASKPHAGNDTPLLPEGSKHFEQLKLWLVMLSDDPEGNFLAYQNRNNPAFDRERSGSSFPTTLPDEVSIDSTGQTIIPVKPDPIGLQPMEESTVEIPNTIGEIPDLNATRGKYKPNDPFDPEIFNRQFGGK